MKGRFKPEIWINKEKSQEESNLNFLNKLSTEVSDIELAKAEVFVDLHKCPWYKNFFDKTQTYKLEEINTAIGKISQIVCERCGTRYNITDYGLW